MSEPYGSWDATGAPPAPRRNKGLIAAITVAVLVLAVIGASAGWLIADRAASTNAGGPGSPTPGVTDSVEPSEPPVAEPSTVPTSSAPNPGGFPLPDVRGTDFEQARKRLRDLGLGVQVFFAATGDDRNVDRTIPVAGQTVRRGIAVKLYVNGRAPYATIPNVVGVPCGQAGSIVADHGLTPMYPTGRSGVVLRLDPEPQPDTLRWNQILRVYCGTAPPSAPGSTASP